MSIHRNVPLHKPRWVGEAQQACQYLRGPATKRISTPGSHACGQAHLFQCVVVVVVVVVVLRGLFIIHNAVLLERIRKKFFYA